MKKQKRAYQKLIEISRKDGYATGNLLDFSYHQDYDKVLIRIKLSRQASTIFPQ